MKKLLDSHVLSTHCQVDIKIEEHHITITPFGELSLDAIDQIKVIRNEAIINQQLKLSPKGADDILWLEIFDFSQLSTRVDKPIIKKMAQYLIESEFLSGFWGVHPDFLSQQLTRLQFQSYLLDKLNFSISFCKSMSIVSREIKELENRFTPENIGITTSNTDRYLLYKRFEIGLTQFEIKLKEPGIIEVQFLSKTIEEQALKECFQSICSILRKFEIKYHYRIIDLSQLRSYPDNLKQLLFQEVKEVQLEFPCLFEIFLDASRQFKSLQNFANTFFVYPVEYFTDKSSAHQAIKDKSDLFIQNHIDNSTENSFNSALSQSIIGLTNKPKIIPFNNCHESSLEDSINVLQRYWFRRLWKVESERDELVTSVNHLQQSLIDKSKDILHLKTQHKKQIIRNKALANRLLSEESTQLKSLWLQIIDNSLPWMPIDTSWKEFFSISETNLTFNPPIDSEDLSHWSIKVDLDHWVQFIIHLDKAEVHWSTLHEGGFHYVQISVKSPNWLYWLFESLEDFNAQELGYENGFVSWKWSLSRIERPPPAKAQFESNVVVIMQRSLGKSITHWLSSERFRPFLFDSLETGFSFALENQISLILFDLDKNGQTLPLIKQMRNSGYYGNFIGMTQEFSNEIQKFWLDAGLSYLFQRDFQLEQLSEVLKKYKDFEAKHIFGDLINVEQVQNLENGDWWRILENFDYNEDFAWHVYSGFEHSFKQKEARLRESWFISSQNQVKEIIASLIKNARSAYLEDFAAQLEGCLDDLDQKLNEEHWSRVEKIFSDFYFSIHKMGQKLSEPKD